jgi:hypothetical protein
MDRDEEYRRQAANAQKAADRASNDADRSAWLRIAQGWLGLIRGRRQPDRKEFDAQVKLRETGQKRSHESH